MEKDDFTFATSVMRTGTETNAEPTARSRQRPAPQGAKFSGMQAVAASLMSDQLRHTGRQTASFPTSGPEVSASPSSAFTAMEAAWLAATDGRAGGGGTRRDSLVKAYAAATRPDMFSVTPDGSREVHAWAARLEGPTGRPTPGGESAALERAQAEQMHPPLALRRRVEGIAPVDSLADSADEVKASGRVAEAMLPAMQSWYRVPASLVPCHLPSPVPSPLHLGPTTRTSETGFIWQRQDALIEDERLVCAIAEHAEAEEAKAKKNTTTTTGDSARLLVPMALSAVAGAAVVPYGRPVKGLEPHHPMCDFFTFTPDEYAQVSASAPAQARRFTFEETCKLFRLYECFGSFPVVADRWHAYDSTAAPIGTRTGQTPDSASASTSSRNLRALPFFSRSLETVTPDSMAATPAVPCVEALCGHYAHVCDGVLALRHARLRRLLLGSRLAGDAPVCERTKDATEPQDEEKTEKDALGKTPRTPTPALLQFFEKLPLWRQRAHRETAMTTATGTPSSAVPDEPGNDGGMASASASGHGFVGLEQLCRQCRMPAAVLQGLATPSLWYVQHDEQRRREAVRQLLREEAAVNVLYQRAVADYVTAIKRTAQQLERVRQHLVGLPLTDVKEAAREMLTHEKDGHGPAGRGVLSVPLSASELSATWRTLPAGADPAMLHAAERVVDTHNRAHVLRDSAAPQQTSEVFDSPHKVVDHAEVDVVPTTTTTTRKLKRARSPGPSNGGAAGRTTTIVSVLEEVVDQVPWECARLVGAVRAGWMLPPPRPLRQPDPHDDEDNDDNDDDDGIRTAGLLERVHASGVVNRATSVIGESILLTYASSVPRLYREVEQELEKHLLEDHRALMMDSAVVVSASEEIRCLYAQNLLLRRLAQRVESVVEGVEKIHCESLTS